MTHHSTLDRRRGRRARVRGFAAIVGMFAIVLALAACGSSSSSSSSASSGSSGSSGSTATNARRRQAPVGRGGAAALHAVQGPPTRSTSRPPLNVGPAEGQDDRDARNEQPLERDLQQGRRRLAKMAGWNYTTSATTRPTQRRSTRRRQPRSPRMPSTSSRPGIPLTRRQSTMAKQRGREVGARLGVSGLGDGPGHRQVDAYAQRCSDGQDHSRTSSSADSGGKGNAVIEHVPAYPILERLHRWLRQAEVQSKCPNCKMKTSTSRFRISSPARTPSILVSALRTNPYANYWCSTSVRSPTASTRLCPRAGFSGKVKIIGEAADRARSRPSSPVRRRPGPGFDPVTDLRDDGHVLRDAEGTPSSRSSHRSSRRRS